MQAIIARNVPGPRAALETAFSPPRAECSKGLRTVAHLAKFGTRCSGRQAKTTGGGGDAPESSIPLPAARPCHKAAKPLPSVRTLPLSQCNPRLSRRSKVFRQEISRGNRQEKFRLRSLRSPESGREAVDQLTEPPLCGRVRWHEIPELPGNVRSHPVSLGSVSVFTLRHTHLMAIPLLGDFKNMYQGACSLRSVETEHGIPGRCEEEIQGGQRLPKLESVHWTNGALLREMCSQQAFAPDFCPREASRSPRGQLSGPSADRPLPLLSAQLTVRDRSTLNGPAYPRAICPVKLR